MATHPSENGHWYDPKTGEPRYTYTNSKGEIKNTTLRECRKFGWVPSVTEILKCAHKEGLVNWKIDQAILSALTCPRIDSESETAYLSRIKSDAREQARKAAERGTLIHAWVQGGFEGDCAPEGVPYFKSALDTVEKECGDYLWACEKSFATDRYGGKCDLHNDLYLLDIKTTEKDLAELKTYEEHWMQAAAYNIGLSWISEGQSFAIPRKCGILYVNALTAESRVVWISEEDITKGWKMFNALLDYWYAKTGLGG